MRRLSIFILLLVPSVAIGGSVFQGHAWQAEDNSAVARGNYGTQEALTITVTSGASFTAGGNLWLRQSDVSVVSTINEALAQLPKLLNYDVTINVGAGTYSGTTTIGGFYGAGSLTISGQSAMASPGLGGSMTGTCTTATTTSCTPTAPGWTASALLDTWFEFTDVGVGTLNYRTPTINTTGVATVLAVSTLNNSDTFRVLVPGVVISTLVLKQNLLPVTVGYAQINGLTETNDLDTTYNVCLFSGSTPSVSNNDKLTYTNSLFKSSSAPTIDDVKKLALTNVVLHVANMVVTGSQRITGDVVASATTTSAALSIKETAVASMGFQALNSTFSPLRLENVGAYIVPSTSIGLVGTSVTGTAGVTIVGFVNMSYRSTPSLTATAAVSVNTATIANWSTLTGAALQVGSSNFDASDTANMYAASGTFTTTGRLNTTAGITNTGLWESPISGITATGSTISDAANTGTTFRVSITGGSGTTGVLATSTYTSPNKLQFISNNSGSNKNIYPATGSISFVRAGVSLGAGVAHVLVNGKTVMLSGGDATSMQLVELD